MKLMPWKSWSGRGSDEGERCRVTKSFQWARREGQPARHSGLGGRGKKRPFPYSCKPSDKGGGGITELH